jgi:hypothetical protein
VPGKEMKSRRSTIAANDSIRHLTGPVSVGLILLSLIFLAVTSPAGELSGNVAVESRTFPQPGLYPDQQQLYFSVSLSPEYYLDWAGGRQSLLFSPFVRVDQYDNNRTHFDLRELFWQYSADNWELKAGVAKVFWGVTESVHLVDLINQTDLIENPDGEEKLGQPMVNVSVIRDWGTVDFFLLPYFRERTFPGRSGRLHFAPPIEIDEAEYESDAGRYRFDWAARWFHTIGDFDIGLSHFSGINREPRILGRINSAGDTTLIPYYDVIDQTSLDLQATRGAWLWKLEAILRSGQSQRFVASAIGFEYTFVGAFGTNYEVGLLAEYLFDERGNAAITPFEDDIFIGVRMALNDVQSTNLLAGAIIDRESGGSAVFVEADRRIGDVWKLNLELRSFVGVAKKDPLYSLHKDDLIQIELLRYF